jgi:hypothetical protein
MICRISVWNGFQQMHLQREELLPALAVLVICLLLVFTQLFLRWESKTTSPGVTN